jgi:hypothetical protein
MFMQEYVVRTTSGIDAAAILKQIFIIVVIFSSAAMCPCMLFQEWIFMLLFASMNIRIFHNK